MNEKKTSINLQDLRRKIYIKAKAEKNWRFWGLYVHVCKFETLSEAYRLAKSNNGAPGIDGVTFEAIEKSGVEEFLTQIQQELINKSYYPMRNLKKCIPKGGRKLRTLGIPSIRDRVVQGAVKLILEPIFESDFQPGSYGYRLNKKAHEAVEKVAVAVIKGQTKVIDVDLKSYFYTIRHHILLNKIAKRVKDRDILRLIKLILRANGKQGVSQGGPISPLFSNIYLNDVDEMLEKAKEVTTKDGYQHMEYARWADDIVITVDGHSNWEWLRKGLYERFSEEMAKIEVSINHDKTKQIDLAKGGKINFLGFDFRRYKTIRNKFGILRTPKMEARTNLLGKLKDVFKRYKSQPLDRVIEKINPILRGWVNYFRIGNSARCFNYVKDWVYKKARRHLMKARKRKGFGWQRWSREWIYQTFNLYTNKSKVRISIFLKIGCFYIFYCKFYSPAESFTFFS